MRTQGQSHCLAFNYLSPLAHDISSLLLATTAYQVEQRLEGLQRQKNQLTVKTQELERLLLSIEAPLRSRCGAAVKQ